MPTKALADLLSRAERVADASGLSLSTISRKLFNDGKGLARVKAGGQLTVKTLEQAAARLSELERKAFLVPPDLETKSRDLTKGLSSRKPRSGYPGPHEVARGFGPAMPHRVPERGFAASGMTNAGPAASAMTSALTHLDRLEAEAIHIMREVVAEAGNPVMLYSIGKDSSVMLHLAAKAFHPARPPFPLLHVDTTWKFREMYRHRDRMAAELGFELIVHVNEEGRQAGVGPFTHGSAIHTDVMKTQALKQALYKGRYDAAFGGARRDEEKSRAKERIFSFRSREHRWDPKNQRPELWSIYNARIHKGESIRVFPLSNWTELDVWQYIRREAIPIPSLYFAAMRPVVTRDGALLMVDDDRMPLGAGETPRMEMVRFRTLGCWPLTGAVRSDATTLPGIIEEMIVSTTSERQGRVIDHDQSASMEKKKAEGYF